MTIVATMGAGALAMTMRSMVTIWTPFFWLRMAAFFYAGIGSLIPLFLNDASRTYIEAYFVFYSDDLLKYNLINLAFLAATMVFIRFYAIIFRQKTIGSGSARFRLKLAPSSLNLGTIAYLFLAVGSVVNFVLILPYQLGYINTTFPAAISEIAQLSFVGIFLCTAWAQKNKPAHLPGLAIVTFIFALTGLLTFAKATLLFPLIMFALGLIYTKPSLPRIAFFATGIVLVFLWSQPIIDYGRSALAAQNGDQFASASVGVRSTILQDYFDKASLGRRDTDLQSGLIRLTYVNVGTYVISLYDRREPGSSYGNARYIFIPRILLKRKPIISDVGRQLSFSATGNDETSVSPGLPPEAYWNFGWPGVVMMAGVVAFVIWLWSLYSIAVQQQSAWHLFAVVLIGARMGMRFDGFFVVEIMGALVFGLAGHLALSLANAIIRSRKHGVR